MSDPVDPVDPINDNLERALVKREQGALQVPGRSPGAISAPVSQGGVNLLAMNVFVPGLGTLVHGQRGLGMAQLGLALLAVPTFIFFKFWLALLMLVGAWGWSVSTGVRLLKANSSSMQWR